jgi:hypothetical protein
VNANVLTLIAVLYVCCFVGFDRIIASHNVRYCAEMTGEGAALDIAYLEHIGVESIPALESFVSEVGSAPAGAAARRLRDRFIAGRANWRSWTISRHRLARELGLIETEGAEE